MRSTPRHLICATKRSKDVDKVMMKKVSIIIPVYNKEDYIERCIDSLLNQTYKNLEIIIINDGSTDQCKKIIDKYASNHEFINCYHLKQNLGVAKARNFGITKAIGDYLYFLDADDYLAPYTIEVLITNIGKYNIMAGTITKNNVNIPQSLEDVDFEVRKYTKAKKTKALRGRTSVNILFNSSFVKKHSLKFDENVKFFTDLTFSIPAIVKVKTLPMVTIPTYIKGECYDPIDNPTLTLIEDKYKIGDFLYIYNSLKSSHGKYISISNYLDKQMLSFYFKNIANEVSNAKDNLEIWFHEIVKSIKKINSTLIKNRNFIEKREIKAISKENKKAVYKWIQCRNAYKKWRKALTSRQNLYKELYHSVFVKLPLKSKTFVFESFAGKSYSCNPRYIYEELLEQGKNYNYVWIFNETNKDIPGKSKQIKRLSLKYYYYLATSKYWVTNSRMPNYIKKGNNTIYLQTWHGTPLKKLGADIKRGPYARNNY